MVDYVNASGNTEAVRGVSFTVQKGEVLGIVGETGSGKTATALAILRLLSAAGRIKNGSILFKNADQSFTDLLTLPENELTHWRGKKIAMIFQDPFSALNPVFSCGEQVAESFQLYAKLTKAQAKDRTIELFKKTGLNDPERMFGSYPHQLSGGQRQRVMIAMALSGEPELIIADEPTASLDIRVQMEVLQLLQSLIREKGMGMIVISHDLAVISKLTDSLIVMQNGKIVESGKTNDVLQHPRHSYTQQLLSGRKSIVEKRSSAAFQANEQRIELKDPSLASNKNDDYNLKKQAETATLLKVQNLSVHYEKTKGLFSFKKEVIKAVDEVSFHIRRGETLGLAGESGSGKTTLGKAIVQLEEPEYGEIFYDGMNPSLIPKKELREFRRKIQMIFQDPYASLNPSMRIGDMLTEIMEVHRLNGSKRSREEKAVELLESVGLTAEHRLRFPHQLSGGQQQRVSIARALAPEPELIICDECVSSLDTTVQALVLDLLNELKQKRNLTYLFISHDLSVVHHMSDRIMIMRNGKIIESAVADKVVMHPENDYTKEMIGAYRWMNASFAQ